jgi:hypothetical protein
MTNRFAFSVLVCAVFLGRIDAAAADCDAGAFYAIEMSGDSVIICIEGTYASTGACPDAGPMLRENPETGEVVVIFTLCEEPSLYTTCYVDECVPSGTYRYGLENPLECNEDSCWPTPFYGEFTVAADPVGCTMSEGNPGPAPFPDPPPWSQSPDGNVCDPDPYGTGAGSGGSGGDCSVASPGASAVFSMNAIAFLVGLLFLVRRKQP